jgi:hypothetical protein
MGFLETFESFFTAEERESEIYNILSVIGVNTEKAILEEVDKEIRHATELLAFGDQKLRSWLAYFLRRVRNVTSARGLVMISIPENDASDPVVNGPVAFLAGWQIRGSNGKLYELMDSVTLSAGQSKTARVVQGHVVEVSGVYSEFIVLPAVNVDLDDIEVTLGGNIVLPVEEVQGYIKPVNGFFAFYHSNKLFVKIYRGDDVGAQPVSYTVKYRVSDGVFGNLGKDKLESFVDDIGLDSVSHKPIPYMLENDPLVGGSDPPQRHELVNLLRQKFFITTNVASVPEYTRWFLSHSEIVGDCLVMSDLSKTMLTNIASFTGVVDVFLLDNDKVPFISGNNILVLNEELYKVRDIVAVNYRLAQRVLNFFIVQFKASDNDVLFLKESVSAIGLFYDLRVLKNNDMSLFSDLDVEQVHRVLSGLYTPVGLRVIPHHLYIYEFTALSASRLVFNSYAGEAAGGWYELWEILGEDEMYLRYSFKEFPQPDGSVPIFRLTGGSLSSGLLVYQDVMDEVGKREGTSISLDFTSLGVTWSGAWKLYCFWPIEKQGMLPIGVELREEIQDLNYVPGFRDLQKVPGRDGGVVFEKYG